MKLCMPLDSFLFSPTLERDQLKIGTGVDLLKRLTDPTGGIMWTVLSFRPLRSCSDLFRRPKTHPVIMTSHMKSWGIYHSAVRTAVSGNSHDRDRPLK